MQAFNPQPDPPGKWGMVGITPYETGRLNVITNDESAAQGCAIALGFSDAGGRTLKIQSKILRKGEAQFTDLMGADAVTRGELRAEIQPYLLDPPEGRNYAPGPWSVACKGVLATFELFDRATGKTSLLVPAVQRIEK